MTSSQQRGTVVRHPSVAGQESAPRQAQASLGILIDAVEEYAIFSLDPHGAVQTWNAGAHRIEGYSEQEIVGRHVSILYPPEDRQAGVPDDELAHATAHDQWSGEGWRLRRDGSTFWASVVTTAVFDPHGRLRGFVSLTRDESDRKAASDARDAQDRLALFLERERIAIRLSETTVHSIFSATIALDCTLTMTDDPRIAKRIEDVRATLESSLVQIRATVAGLARDQGSPGSPSPAPRTDPRETRPHG